MNPLTRKITKNEIEFSQTPRNRFSTPPIQMKNINRNSKYTANTVNLRNRTRSTSQMNTKIKNFQMKQKLLKKKNSHKKQSS